MHVNHEVRQILVLNSIERVKPGFLLSLMCVFPESNETKFWSQSLHLQNQGILQTRKDQKWVPLTFFKYKNKYQTEQQ